MTDICQVLGRSFALALAVAACSSCSARVDDAPAPPASCDGYNFIEMAVTHPPCSVADHGLLVDVCAFDDGYVQVDLWSPKAFFAFGCDDRERGVSEWFGHEVKEPPK